MDTIGEDPIRSISHFTTYLEPVSTSFRPAVYNALSSASQIITRGSEINLDIIERHLIHFFIALLLL